MSVGCHETLAKNGARYRVSNSAEKTLGGTGFAKTSLPYRSQHGVSFGPKIVVQFLKLAGTRRDRCVINRNGGLALLLVELPGNAGPYLRSDMPPFQATSIATDRPSPTLRIYSVKVAAAAGGMANA